VAIVAVSTPLQLPVKNRNPLRVLVADDNLSMRTAIDGVLRDLPNLEVCAVTSNGPETIDAALALKADLLIIDQ
jgi:chemotaxis response regulator CheB